MLPKNLNLQVGIAFSIFCLSYSFMINGLPFSKNSRQVYMNQASLLTSKLNGLSPLVSKGYQVTNFRWQNCVKESSLRIQAFNLKPDPIISPGNMSMSCSAFLDRHVDAPIKTETTVQIKQSIFYISIPCIANFGSCLYRDICPTLAALQGSCPDPIKRAGLTCSCPLKPGHYVIDDMVFPVLEQAPDGEYRFTYKFFDGDETLGCLQFDFKLVHRY